MKDPRLLLFVCWALVVSAGFADLAFASSSFFGLAVLCLAWLPLEAKGAYTRSIPRAHFWPVLCVVGAIVALLLFGAFSGATKASNEWFLAHPEVRGFFCGALWIAYMQGGYSAFRAKYLHGSKPSPAGT
jgi:hypothetical protein